MNSRQLEMFTDFGGPLARPTDPDTSRAAAGNYLASGKIGPDRRAALRALHRWPGRTAAELEAELGVRDGKIRKRLAWLADELRAAYRGPKRVCSRTQETVQTWWPVPLAELDAETRAAVEAALREGEYANA